MIIGLPGTGIGGIFYLLLAVFMPVKEFAHTLKGQTNLKRWGFIALQLFFVFGIVAAMWSELWLLNRSLIWVWEVMKISGPLPVMGNTLHQTKLMAIASATASFVSLTFVIIAVHILRFFVHKNQGIKSVSNAKKYPTPQIVKPTFFCSQNPIISSSSVSNRASSIAS